MPHKLEIGLRLKPPSQYRKFLSKLETVSGKDTKFAVIVKNIGHEPVPKGNVEMQLHKPAGLGAYDLFSTAVEVKGIQPDRRFTIDWKANLIVPGMWIFYIKANFEDKEEIEYHKAGFGEPYSEKWEFTFYAVDRRQLDLQMLLQKLIEKEEV